MPVTKSKTVKYEKYVSPGWWKKNWVEALTIIGGIISINLIFIADAFRATDVVNPPVAGQLGDFVGGFIGTFFALASVVFLYSTLKDQRQSTTIEKFETKYFELIKMHRENVADIAIGKDQGKKLFVLFIREFRSILQVTKKIAKDYKLNFTEEELFVISYYALFFGVGPNSSRMLKSVLEEEFDKSFVESYEKALNNGELKSMVQKERGIKYVPFEGHQSRLGHYYRHLFQTVTYIDVQQSDIDKGSYAKTVRAQLTTHEQALLFINSLTPIGNVWWEKGLITRYKFVKNIPHGFFDKESEIDLESYFPDDYFEWQERKNNKNLKQPS